LRFVNHQQDFPCVHISSRTARGLAGGISINNRAPCGCPAHMSAMGALPLRSAGVRLKTMFTTPTITAHAMHPVSCRFPAELHNRGDVWTVTYNLPHPSTVTFRLASTLNLRCPDIEHNPRSGRDAVLFRHARPNRTSTLSAKQVKPAEIVGNRSTMTRNCRHGDNAPANQGLAKTKRNERSIWGKTKGAWGSLPRRPPQTCLRIGIYCAAHWTS